MATYPLFLSRLLRRKEAAKEAQACEATNLSRCLNTVDLTALGIGSTLGLGLYVLTGQIAAEYSGPAIVVAWIIAGVASTFSGLCYAEFGARVPRAGSAYVYSYVTVGEFIAFVIGWNMILEYVIGTASVASGYSEYLNSLTNHVIRDGLNKTMPMNVNGLNSYPDLLALAITIFVSALLSFGVSESTKFNNLCTGLNLLVVIFVIICGSFKADIKNWNIKKSSIPRGAPNGGGQGGFAPFGFVGIMRGAAKCFYGFVGFDCVATTGEEVKNPKRAIPIAFGASLIIIFISYVSVAIIQTLMQPYYLQGNGYALPYVFQLSGYTVGKWIISIGALAGLSTSILGAMFPLPRVIYAMATDGVIFRWLGKVNKKTRTPFIATIISGMLAGFMATMFKLDQLINMMSIGTLMAYSLVCSSILILRYRKEEKGTDTKLQFTMMEHVKQVLNLDRYKQPNCLSSNVSFVLIVIIFFSSLATSVFPVYFMEKIGERNWIVILLLTISLLFLTSSVIFLHQQPQDTRVMSFMVPAVPLIPSVGIFVNIYLMLSLPSETWIRFGVWMVIGLIIYFGYGQFNSSEEYLRKGIEPPTTRRTESQPESTTVSSVTSPKSSSLNAVTDID